jgi:membrane-anchored protein YejM (alkaline phosphatase superfamily)
MLSENKKLLLRWVVWFCLGNLVLFWAICFRYIGSIPWMYSVYTVKIGIKVSTILCFILGYVGHLGVLAFIPALIIIPAMVVIPSRLFIFGLAVLLETCLAGFLLADSIVYSLYHYHINGILLDLIFQTWDQKVLGLSTKELAYYICFLMGIVLAECVYAVFLWKKIILQKRGYGGAKAAGIVIGVSAFFAYSFVFLCQQTRLMNLMIPVARVLPFQSQVMDKMLEVAYGKSVFEKLTEREILQPESKGTKVVYPLHPMQCVANKKPLNVVVIGIDTWRADMLDSKVMPNVTHFAKSAQVFSHHMSGGDCTEPGIFSFFYSLPAYYRNAMYRANANPVFIEELVRNHYQFGVFGSATLTYPAFDHTVFRLVKNLKGETPGKTAYDRDKKITEEFQQFIQQTAGQKQPFFSFLFYDAAHSYCGFDEALNPFHPVAKTCGRFGLTNESDPAPYFNRYKNALLLIDAQVQQVLTTLKQHQLLDNTVVIITGDHGEEFNDNRLGYWGHASNFTHYQVQTPLIIYWPGDKPSVFTHLTSHYDVVPTLMKRLFNCENAPTDYSVGRNLLDKRERPYLIMNSYIELGIVSQDSIVTIRSSGDYQIQNKKGQLSDQALNTHLMTQAFSDLRRYTR